MYKNHIRMEMNGRHAKVAASEQKMTGRNARSKRYGRAHTGLAFL